STLQRELVAQVHVPHFLVGENLLRRSRRDDLAFTDYVGAFTDTKGLTDVVVGDQHADAPVAQVFDNALNVDHRDRVDAGEGLIQQHEARFRRQRPGNFDAAPLAARQAHARGVANVADVQ